MIKNIIIAVLLTMVFFMSLTLHGKTVTVTIEKNTFLPNDLIVNVGDTVRWINKSKKPHSVVADNGLFHSVVINPGKQFKITLNKVDQFKYYCESHRVMGMLAFIEVR